MTAQDLIDRIKTSGLDLSLPIRVTIQNGSDSENVIDLEIDQVVYLNPGKGSPSISITCEDVMIEAETNTQLAKQ